jgi:hypothetical protein
MTDFAALQTPHGRPLLIRPTEIAVIEGATDARDATGDLWGHNPQLPYRRLVTKGGSVLYVADSPQLLTQLHATPPDDR